MAEGIHQAVLEDDFQAVKHFVEQDPEALNRFAPADSQKSVTPIHLAARHGRIAMAAFLFGLGADLELQDAEHACTALGWAVYFDQVEMVNLMIQFGADVNGGCRPLMVATNQGHTEVAEILQQHGARL